jgi:DNA ligase-1
MTILLSELVDASEQVAQTGSRLAKRDAIAACLRRAEPAEVEIVVAWLAGDVRQGRIGIGYATLARLRGTPAGAAGLTVAEVDAALERIASSSGKGSAGERSALLRALFERATASEQDFLVRLLVGELRQGALEGVMIDAIAAAAEVPVPHVRRAATARACRSTRQAARSASTPARSTTSPSRRRRSSRRSPPCRRAS